MAHCVVVQVASWSLAFLPSWCDASHCETHAASVHALTHCEYASQSEPAPHAAFCVAHLLSVHPLQSVGWDVVPESTGVVVPESVVVVPASAGGEGFAYAGVTPEQDCCEGEQSELQPPHANAWSHV